MNQTNRTPEVDEDGYIIVPGLDMRALGKELDRAKAKVFTSEHALFFGSLLCNIEVVWDTSIPSLTCNGSTIQWNPQFFQSLPAPVRVTLLMEELWHIALLHPMRAKKMPFKVLAQIACDIQVRLELFRLRMPFPHGIDRPDSMYEGMTTEEIYDLLCDQAKVQAGQSIQGFSPDEPMEFGDVVSAVGDLDSEDAGTRQAAEAKLVNLVLGAQQLAAMGGGDTPGNIRATISQFVQPKIQWETLVHRWMNELQDTKLSWARPNRQYLNQDMLLPGLVDDDGRLEHLVYFLDVSGSISDAQIIRFNSEVKYVKQLYNPRKMTLVQFDVIIQDVRVIEENDTFDYLEVVGRGGTSLKDVRAYIMEHKPTAAIVFSDMDCTPMKPLPETSMCPILWIAHNARGSVEVPHGTVISINE